MQMARFLAVATGVAQSVVAVVAAAQDSHVVSEITAKPEREAYYGNLHLCTQAIRLMPISYMEPPLTRTKPIDSPRARSSVTLGRLSGVEGPWISWRLPIMPKRSACLISSRIRSVPCRELHWARR